MPALISSLSAKPTAAESRKLLRQSASEAVLGSSPSRGAAARSTRSETFAVRENRRQGQGIGLEDTSFGVGREDSPLRSYLPDIELLGAEGKRAKENKDSKDTVKMRRRAEALLAGLGDKDVVAKAYLVALPYLILRQLISCILTGDDHAREKLVATCPKEQKRQCQLLTEALAQLQTSSSNASGAVFLFSTHDELFDLVPLAAVAKARR